jgi:hypothetical protein
MAAGDHDEMEAPGKEVLMRIPRLKISLAVALVVAGVAAAVAIGAPTRAAGPTPNQQAVLNAIQKTSKVPSLNFAFALGLSGGVTGASGYHLTGSGGADTVHGTSSFTVNLGPLASLLGGATGGAKIPTTVGIVSTKTAVYVHAPSVASQVKPGAEWLKFTASAIPSSVTKSVNPGALSSVNPQKALAALSASISVHKLGTTTVRGTSTTHYSVTISATKLVAALPKSQQAGEAKALKQAGVTTIPVQVYIDGSGYVRRISVALSHLKLSTGSGSGSAGQSGSVSVLVDLFNFGAHVHVAAPPASKTVSGDKLVSQLLGGVGG